MKILYGVQGTGNGHISRARMMARHFQHRATQIDFLFSGRAPGNYFDMQCFGDFQTRTGLSFIAHRGAVSYWRTLLHSHPIKFLQEIRSLDLRHYDLIITDFEPLTAWAGKLAGIPVLGIGHQYAFAHPGVPRRRKYLLSHLVLRNFAPTSIGLGLHWSDYGAPILPPIVPPLDEQNRKIGSTILVYLPFEDQTAVTRLLNTLGAYTFIQYSPALSDGTCGNVTRRTTNLEGFKRDLKNCRAVICNAGFELISECLHLGKPVMAKPVRGQGEQHANALALTQLGYADITGELKREHISAWLDHLPRREPIIYPDVAEALVDWVLQGQWDDPQSLSQRLWRKVRKG